MDSFRAEWSLNSGFRRQEFRLVATRNSRGSDGPGIVGGRMGREEGKGIKESREEERGMSRKEFGEIGFGRSFPFAAEVTGKNYGI